MRWVKFCCLVVLIFLISCSNDTNPVAQEEEDLLLSKVDKANGVVLELDGIRESYAFNDVVTGVFRISNKSISTIFPIYSLTGPLAEYQIWDSNGKRVGAFPNYYTWTVYDTDFEPGEVLEYQFQWLQREANSELKLPSGRYSIHPVFRGSQELNATEFGAEFEIVELGDPLSIQAYYVFSDRDSLRVELTVRNRSSKNIRYDSELPIPVLIEFIDGRNSQVVASENHSLNANNIQFFAGQDKLAYEYIANRKDLMNSGLAGNYFLKLTLDCSERIIAAGTNVLLY